MERGIEILKRGFESKEFDYKGPCEWNESDKKALCELVKDILAMANTQGGWIVIGVSETDFGWEYIGLTDEQAVSFKHLELTDSFRNMPILQ